MKKEVLYDNGTIQWTVLARDPNKPESIIDTNEYIIQVGDESMLLDPGGMEIFPSVLSMVSEVIELSSIKAYLCSHQDPDIMSSLPMWMELTPNAKVYVSWLWNGFIAHFGYKFAPNLYPVPDEGMHVKLGDQHLQLIPAHYLHSSGNFHLFDPESKILFSGDVGAALLPNDADLYVSDFSSHIHYMQMFHQRWMPSNSAKDMWLARVRKLGVEMMCPQHGAIFRGDDVERFFDWFDALQVGKAQRLT
ncbi:oxygen-binding di-iron domain-containing protein [Legionella drancourtii]|uniref:Metallo-beta-lactamase domain-containing protein n=1 Tax=Legionella drancourtii LLAP12 TaxID=658187 RepID=G9EL37_9GAMM|nr:MBL fold metallo-hydrolase [Legionella drancourtii]EHL31926.1 hypothetical protein LDG_6093 [Legionella drancourtii LLAP12]